jgi:hypothetical protein
MKYVADINHVKETSLLGGIDVEAWRDVLQAEGLEPCIQNGRGQALLRAADARFRGIRFRELSISLLARTTDDGVEGWFLAHAFNSLRLFAWVERTMFSTPYYAGRIASQATMPPMMEAQDAHGGSLRAAASDAPRQPTREGVESWNGPIFLPALPGRPHGRRNYFHAVLSGEAQAFPFSSEIDELQITPSLKSPVFLQIAVANFTPTE